MISIANHKTLKELAQLYFITFSQNTLIDVEYCYSYMIPAQQI
jgi:hypothetical protein